MEFVPHPIFFFWSCFFFNNRNLLLQFLNVLTEVLKLVPPNIGG